MSVIALSFFLLALYEIFLERVDRIPYKVSGRRKNQQVLEDIGICNIKKQQVWHWLITKQTISIFGFACSYHRILGCKQKIYFEEYHILFTNLPYVMRKTIYKLYLKRRYPFLHGIIYFNLQELIIQMDEVMDDWDDMYKGLLQHIKERIIELIETDI